MRKLDARLVSLAIISLSSFHSAAAQDARPATQPFHSTAVAQPFRFAAVAQPFRFAAVAQPFHSTAVAQPFRFAAAQDVRPPTTRQESFKETLHGVEIADPYRWLEDQNSPETRGWIEAQSAYTRAYLDRLPGRDAIRRRLEELLKIESIGAPTERNGSYFLMARRVDQDQYVLYRRKGLKGQDEVLVDPQSMSADKTTSVSLLEVSKDGSLLAYGVRQGGEDEIEVRWLDVETKKDLPDHLPKCRLFGISLKPDNSGFYYSVATREGPRVRYHAMGTDPSQDKEMFGKGYGSDKIIVGHLSEDGKRLLIEVSYGSAAQKTELYLQDVAEHGPIVPVITDIQARFDGDLVGDSLYILTSWRAPNGCIYKVDLKQPKWTRAFWKEIVPPSEDVISGMSLVGGHLFVGYLHRVASQIKEFDREGKLLRAISLPAPGSAGVPRGRWGHKEAFYSFTSFPVPPVIVRYDVETGKQEEFARLNIPVDQTQFEVKQVFYPSKDGTKIPMFLVYKRGLPLDGARPTLLTGYGGFGSALTPSFSSSAALWAEHGGVYAVANLRGGGEFGEKWHRAGMREHKQNVFDDFVAAAEWLIKNSYTNRSKLAILGGSNGGLLVGAAMTQRPELFQAVVCVAPLLDMLRYQKFLVAPYWVPEYGSADDPWQFKFLVAYSPYHHVKKGVAYPAILLLTGDADTRVAPLHARKMAAMLQADTASDRPILLHYDTKTGHSGGKPISKVIDDQVDLTSFLFAQLGVAP